MTAPDWLWRLPFAHRGLHDRANGIIENSLSACLAAAEAGYGIEVDVQPAAGGTAMVFHDADLDRLTAATGPVWQRPAEELSQIALNGSSGDTIPTLGAVLAAVAGRVPVLVELKQESGPAGGLAEGVARALAAYEGPVAIMSFAPWLAMATRGEAPGVIAGLVGPMEDEGGRYAPAAEIAMLDRFKPDFLSYSVKALDSPTVAAARARGIVVNCWTVRTAEDIARARLADTMTFEGFRP